jgi:hypothetical protein
VEVPRPFPTCAAEETTLTSRAPPAFSLPTGNDDAAQDWQYQIIDLHALDSGQVNEAAVSGHGGFSHL